MTTAAASNNKTKVRKNLFSSWIIKRQNISRVKYDFFVWRMHKLSFSCLELAHNFNKNMRRVISAQRVIKSHLMETNEVTRRFWFKSHAEMLRRRRRTKSNFETSCFLRVSDLERLSGAVFKLNNLIKLPQFLKSTWLLESARFLLPFKY